MEAMMNEGLKQTHEGQLYMQHADPVTQEIKQIFFERVISRTPFDLRPAHGHLWNWRGDTLVAESCGREECKACRG